MSSLTSGLPNPAAKTPNTSNSPDPAHLFNDADQTSHYARHRPHYPPQLYDLLYTHAFPDRRPPFHDLTVVDVATGNGQSLGPMPTDFGTCVALDVSPAQLSEVAPALRQRVQMQLGDAHCTGLPAGSVDLMTVGQALHWFRVEDFYNECRRLLKPSGVLAAWTYDFGQLYGFDGSQQLYEQLHVGILGPYWAPGRQLVDRYYVDLEPGLIEHFGEVRRLQLPMTVSTTPDELWLRQECLAGLEAAGAGGGRLTLQRTITLLLAMRPRAPSK
ncbi:hypothetical protein VOLCADRAFT_99779 [Volvox carteri f. nagariensis]|uniref:Methyltransferase type 11 domain-containing protein n=1 Tax=Volvox carteri f. nagariensis TaxID=3068 RepID=D8UIM5_VOLCA|nr:uncharacterized protein VOLCADRAFT_99779 [Volvox carteri f. nagariensis]EFJ40421.1 hypothetical protein VOLCADRAFT_99779 [Volvox carteri f. nagariensis]|eukprot:XP_002958501.1 hypothetical protein VOLCADRAFT_99779 [Volvox carteri f. nagariensis]